MSVEPTSGSTISVETAISQLRTAEHSWQSALKQHRLTPPDAGYSRRLRDLADACEQQQIAFQYAAKAGLGWDPLPPVESRRPPAELRPDSGRRGDPRLWQHFDSSVEDLAKALEGISLPAIARAFGEMADTARELSRNVGITAEIDTRAGQLVGPYPPSER